MGKFGTKLEFDDLVALNRYNAGKLNFNDALILDNPVTRDRLVNAGVVDANGVLSRKGLELAMKVRQTEAKLQRGVPISSRKAGDPRTVVTKAPLKQWYGAKVRGKGVVTNGEILFFGKPVTGMKPLPWAGQSISNEVATLLKGKFIPVFPHTYQVISLGGVEFIWLADEKEKLWIAVQVKYYDFLIDRFPSGKFFGKDPFESVQLRVVTRGLKNDVIAFVMPMALQREDLKPERSGDAMPE